MELDKNNGTAEPRDVLLQASARYGLIVGLVEMIALYLLYAISIEAYLGPPRYGIGIVIITMVVYYAKQVRDLNGGYFEYGEAFLHVFAIFMVSAVVTLLFTYLHYNVLAPELEAETRRLAIENMEEMMNMFGGGSEQMDEVMEELEKQDFSFGVGSIFSGTLASAFIWGIVSAIIAGFIKKREPEDFLQ